MPITLSELEPMLIAANFRGVALAPQTAVVDGHGRDGDLIAGTVIPPPGKTLVILDHLRRFHRITEPTRVVAVLGSRDSSTHVCAAIPEDGIDIHRGLDLHWVGGESGMVSRLVRENDTDSLFAPERSAGFQCLGLLQPADGGVLGVEDFAVQPQCKRFDLPLVLVAATSSEAGKTVLVGRLIRYLSESGLRVGAIKATGTGGRLDCEHYLQNGAWEVLDQVDAGLITTHGSGALVRQRIVRVFRRMHDLGVEVVLAELGGDLATANNPTIFGIDEIVQRAAVMFVIANDALAALGVATLNADRLHFPPEKICYLTSPFRNHDGMARRFAAVGIADPWEPNSIELMGQRVMEDLRKAGRR